MILILLTFSRTVANLKLSSYTTINLEGCCPYSIVSISSTMISIKLGRNKIEGTVPPQTGNLVNPKVFATKSN